MAVMPPPFSKYYTQARLREIRERRGQGIRLFLLAMFASLGVEGGHPLASVCQGLERSRWRILSFPRIHVQITVVGSPDNKTRARVLDGQDDVPRHAPVTHQVQGSGANRHDQEKVSG